MTSFIGPIVGVVDGSNAAPGEVGEFLSATGTFAYAAAPASSTGSIPLLNVPPGDWDFTISANFTTSIGWATFYLTTLPAGMSNTLAAGMPGSPGVVIELIGQCGRGSFAIATQLTFTVMVNQTGMGAEPAGTMKMRLEARRRR